MGDGWQFNFPWMTSSNNPSYIHIWNGEGYRIPISFWAGSTGTFENHQGDNFRLVRLVDGTIVLYDKSGTAFSFGTSPNHALMSIADSTGNNFISFTYGSNSLISCITDTVGRAFTFSYFGTPALLQTISEVSGTCTIQGSTVRSVNYLNNGQSLTRVTDPLGRKTYYSYNATGSSTVAPWLLSRITYPTQWLTNYTYSSAPLGTQANTYRVKFQITGPSATIPSRQFAYSYSMGPGDQITGSTVTSYNATQIASYTKYAFSFMADIKNVTDINGVLLSGDEQFFGVNGRITKEVVLVSDGHGNIGSYTNYFRYDLWGNPIYSRKVINSSSNSYHETFSDYYNNGLPSGFYSLAETISQANHTRTDNNWNVTSGQWTVVNGEYMLTGERGNQSLIEVTHGDAAFQMTVRWLAGQYFEGYIGFRYQNNGNHYEVYLSAYDNTLRFVKVTGGTYTRLQAATVTPSKNVHYVIRVESSGYTHTVYLNGTLEFQVTDQDGSMLTGRYLALGTYSSTSPTNPEQISFSNIYVQPLSSTFSNSFFSTGPNSNVHWAIAGTAELQNGTGSTPMERYYSYYTWGGLNQIKQRYNPPSGTQWLTTTRTYDIYGNPKTLTDPRGNVTSYGYSTKYLSAYLTSLNQTLAPGGTLISNRYGYNFTIGTMLSSVDPNGYNTTYKYDILGRTTRATYPNNDFVSYTYNDSANYVNATNENAWLTQQRYDGLARFSTTNRFLNGKLYSNATNTYDWQDRALTTRNPVGNTYYYSYDPLGRITNSTSSNRKSVLQTYNDLLAWVRTTDQDGSYRCNYYDRLGRLISVVEYADSNCNPRILNGNNYVTNYNYDEVGNLRTVTNAATRSTTYSYDNLNRLTVTSYPDGTSQTYTYDNSGNLVRKVDRANIKTLSSYDSLNRISAVTYCGTTIIGTSYTYDKNSNPLQILNQNATVSYIYDSRNRVLNETYAVNPASRTIVDLGCSGSGGNIARTGGVSKTYTLGWTFNGELLNTLMYPTISVNNPDITVKYAYDGLGRVLNVTNQATSAYLARSFTYYKNDQVKGFQFGNNLIQNYTYDSLSRPLMLTLSGTTAMSLAYTYNNTGTVASVTGSVKGVNVNEQYRYDPLRRLTNSSVTSSGSTTTSWYEYDSLGNRVRQKLNSTLTRYSYNSVNELTNSTMSSAPQTTIAYSYDANGNMKTQNVTSSGTVRWAYTWDASNRLLKVSNSTGKVLYAYDGMERMVEQAEGSSTWFLAYRGSEVLYRNLLNTNNQAYVFAAGMKIARVVDRTAMYYYHVDALGSTRLITYNDATYVFTDNYQPFGRDNGTPKGNLANTEKDRFTGKPYSVATGLYYEYQRWYDPTLGRFISPDPFAGHMFNPQTLDPYTYVENLPTTLKDPTGQDSSMYLYGAPCYKTGSCFPTNGPSFMDLMYKEESMMFALVSGLLLLAGLFTDEFFAEEPDWEMWQPTSAADYGQDASLEPLQFPSQSTEASVSSEGDSLFSDFNFRDRKVLDFHFDKHLTEFSPRYATSDEYLAGARSFMDRAAGEGNIFIQGSGTKIYAIEPGSGTFVAYDPSTRTIFTYMVHPNGWDWVESQIAWQGWWPYPVAP